MKKIIKIKAKSISYGSKRNRSAVKYPIFHFTALKNDTAVNEGRYYANVNTRSAGAHFFIDRKGNIVKSIDLNRVAWSVGGSLYTDIKKTGGAKLHNIATNYNSVSIELCDIADKYPSKEQIEAVKYVLKYIRKYCKNATRTPIRHFDVTGKYCPATMMNKRTWEKFLRDIGEK